ncbi:MAG: alpha-L-fucosidase [Bryobacterales bacterium]|nr:alpha-L-fucosidase [Bryobacterales bacterium]
MVTMTRRTLLKSVLAPAGPQFSAPEPYGAIPAARQLVFQKMEVYAFLHFGVNTFTGRDLGGGDESPDVFQPGAFDAGAILNVLKAGGMQGVILTCKHHDGFCLWPTRSTEHSVKNGSWRGGRGDVVKDIAAAAARHGLRFGVYLSPWDRNNAYWGRPEYIPVYRQQLRELLTGYGPVFEVWHDGFKRPDGYYGGARDKRYIDDRTYYDWEPTWEMVRRLQPDANIMSAIGPDIRWVGNESGVAGDPCWATYDPVRKQGDSGEWIITPYQEATHGHRHGARWMPAECPVSIRPGWFWHERENNRVKTTEQLVDLYFQSVGRGAHFLLNVPPDRRGLLYESDAAALAGFGSRVSRMFQTNLAARARIRASAERGPVYRAANLIDGEAGTCWGTPDRMRSAEVILEFPGEVRAGIVRLREHTPFGQRIDRFAIDTWQAGDWQTAAEAASIGACRLIRLQRPLRTTRMRLRIVEAAASPALEEWSVFEGEIS